MIVNKQIVWQINDNLNRILQWCDEVELKVKDNRYDTESLSELRNTTQRLSNNLFDDCGYVITE